MNRRKRGYRFRVEPLEERRLLAVFTPSPLISDGEPGSLRDVISQANQNGESDVILLESGNYLLEVAGAEEDDNLTGDFDIYETEGLTIRGAGASETRIDAGGIDRVFDLRGDSHNVEILLEDLTITGGISDEGGGIRMDLGGQDLKLNAVQVTGNRSTGEGGGVFSDAGDIDIQDSVISDNVAAWRGGGLHTEDITVAMRNSSLLNNRTDYDGGGIFGDCIRFEFSNTTISGNSSGGFGGGMYLGPDTGGTVIHATIADNFATESGGGIYGSTRSGVVRFSYSIIANNRIETGDGDVAGRFGASAYNLIEASEEEWGDAPTSTNLIGVDPNLGELTTLPGGLVPFYPLLPESRAIDAIAPIRLNDPSANLSNQVSAYIGTFSFVSSDDLTGENPGLFEQLFVLNWNGMIQVTQNTQEFPIESFAGRQRQAIFVTRADLVGQNPDMSRELFLYDDRQGISQLTSIIDPQAEFRDLTFDTGYSRSFAFVSDADLLGTNSDGNPEVYSYTSPDQAMHQITDSTNTTNATPVFTALNNFTSYRVTFTSDGDYTGENPDENRELFYADQEGTIRQITVSTSGTSSAPNTFTTGDQLAFRSDADLTGQNPAAVDQLFLYDFGSESLSQLTSLTHGEITSVALYVTGVLFSSTANLTQQNPNGLNELYVYSYQDGIRQMTFGGIDGGISSGAGETAFVSSANLLGDNSTGNPAIYRFAVNELTPDLFGVSRVIDGNGDGKNWSDIGTVEAGSPSVLNVAVNRNQVDPPDLPSGPQPVTWLSQRSDLREINIEFNQSVIADASDFRLINLGVDADLEPDQIVKLNDANVQPRGTQVNLVFEPNELSDGVYQLEILPSLVAPGGYPLDGNQDGIPGDAYVVVGSPEFGLIKLTGDFNGDQAVSIFDFATIAYWFGETTEVAPSYVDLNVDGGVSIFDMEPFLANFLVVIEFPVHQLRGETRGDHKADGAKTAGAVEPLAAKRDAALLNWLFAERTAALRIERGSR